ncbi:MAG: SDR family oxidoreductase [Thermodesulfobacteriota bacterium]
METISIMGCGWLGLPLGEYLVKKGFKVKGSTTEPEKLISIKEKNIEPYLIILNPNIQGENYREFFSTDILIVDFPPERRDDIIEYHQKQIKSLISAIKHTTIQNVIFTSSTSVYPDVDREVFEDEKLIPYKTSGRALLGVEEILRECKKFNTTIIRLGGLIGYDRMPGRFLAGKKDLKNGDAPVNLIHRDDCVEIIYQIIKNEVWGEVLNACADFHPTRKKFYTEQAKLIGLTPPTFNENAKSKYKLVSNKKLKKVLNYEFKFPDPSKIIET